MAVRNPRASGEKIRQGLFYGLRAPRNTATIESVVFQWLRAKEMPETLFRQEQVAVRECNACVKVVMTVATLVLLPFVTNGGMNTSHNPEPR